MHENKITKKDKNGYTLVEVILVIAITGITFTTLYSLYANTVRRNVDSRYEVIAANLAQEGVEIVRAIRDENVMLSRDINDGLAGNCRPYFREGTPNPECDANRRPEVELDSGFYRNCLLAGCVTPEKVVFERECNIGGDTERMVVTCTVQWDSFVNPAIARSADATVTLTNWQSN